MDRIQRLIDRVTNRIPFFLRDGISTLLSLILRDVPRVLVLGGVGVWLLQPDLATWTLVRYSLGLAFFIVLASHMMRRLLMPKVDLQDLIKEAVTGKSLSAALSALSVCLVLIAVMVIMAMPFFR